MKNWQAIAREVPLALTKSLDEAYARNACAAVGIDPDADVVPTCQPDSWRPTRLAREQRFRNWLQTGIASLDEGHAMEMPDDAHVATRSRIVGQFQPGQPLVLRGASIEYSGTTRAQLMLTWEVTPEPVKVPLAARI